MYCVASKFWSITDCRHFPAGLYTRKWNWVCDSGWGWSGHYQPCKSISLLPTGQRCLDQKRLSSWTSSQLQANSFARSVDNAMEDLNKPWNIVSWQKAENCSWHQFIAPGIWLTSTMRVDLVSQKRQHSSYGWPCRDNFPEILHKANLSHFHGREEEQKILAEFHQFQNVLQSFQAEISRIFFQPLDSGSRLIKNKSLRFESLNTSSLSQNIQNFLRKIFLRRTGPTMRAFLWLRIMKFMTFLAKKNSERLFRLQIPWLWAEPPAASGDQERRLTFVE